MAENVVLRGLMRELDLTRPELARQMNDAVIDFTGSEGTYSERSIANLLNGRTQRPYGKTAKALEAVFGCGVDDLGFAPPARTTRKEPAVERRNFLTSAAAAAAIPLLPPRPRIGRTDVARLRGSLDSLNALDDHKGGHEALGRAAQAGAEQALNLQSDASSAGVRAALFSAASEFNATAAWSYIDARQLDRAQQLLAQALAQAGLARDSSAAMRVWNLMAMLSVQRKRHTEALAAAEAAKACGITRRDPLYASLAHARAALAQSQLNDRQAALRSLGHAEDALTKAQPDQPRPSWVAFYDQAELTALSAIVRDRLGDSAYAEQASHQAIARIPHQFRRNRALATARLALTQLHQGEVELSCDTAADVFPMMGGELPARMRVLLGDFYRDLITLAPDAQAAREWGDRYRAEWS